MVSWNDAAEIKLPVFREARVIPNSNGLNVIGSGLRVLIEILPAAFNSLFTSFTLEAKTTSERLEVQNQLRYVNQDVERLKGQKEYYENATSYSTLTLNIREGSGISLFSWNYYFQRSLNWIEGVVGVIVSLSVILVPVYILFILFNKLRKKE